MWLVCSFLWFAETCFTQVLDLNECSKLTNEIFLWLIKAKQQGNDVTLQRMTVVWNKGNALCSLHSACDFTLMLKAGMTEEVRRRLRQELPTLLIQIHYRTT